MNRPSWAWGPQGQSKKKTNFQSPRSGKSENLAVEVGFKKKQSGREGEDTGCVNRREKTTVSQPHKTKKNGINRERWVGGVDLASVHCHGG